jgi:hypothetical protein
MKAKEKAKELVDKFYSKISGMELSYISKLIQYPNGDSHFENTKQCALICVKEIISLRKLDIKNPDISDWDLESIDLNINYWQEVKTEIEKL